MMKPKLNSTKYIPFVIVFLVLTMAIGYAVINSVTFDIQGRSNAKTQDGIFITEVKKLSSNGSETYKTNLAYQNILDGRIELDDNPNSTVSLEISFYNNSEYDYIFEDITYQDDLEDAYSNKNISYSFDSQGETIKVGNPLVITVTFDYLDSNNITDNILDFILNFKFKPVYIETFAYTGNYQIWTVPFDAIYKIELWGAQGGGSYGGLGGYTSGNIYLDKDDRLFVYVGGYNDRGVFDTVFNGGGDAVAESSVSGHENRYTPGGGATDVRLTSGPWNNFESLKSRIMVAGAGGGGYFGGGAQSALYGAAGGGLTGYNGVISITTDTFTLTESTGGTQTAGGNGGESSYIPSTSYDGNGFNGGFGFGGGGQDMYKSGGGSGYYGGGSSGVTRPRAGSGAGGSSFISGHNGCNAISDLSTIDNIVHTGQSIHYSNYKFTNTIMIDGVGYNWTTSKGSYIGMPTHDGKSTMEGNTGNGYAKITLLEIE